MDIKFITGKVSIGKYIDVTSRYLFNYIYKKVTPYNIKRHEFKVLLELYHNEGICQEDIVENLKIRKSEVAKAIKGLIANDYIYKIKNPENKRIHNLYITKKGLTIKNDIINILLKSSEILTQNISEEDLKVAKKVMKQMANNIYIEANIKEENNE